MKTFEEFWKEFVKSPGLDGNDCEYEKSIAKQAWEAARPKIVVVNCEYGNAIYENGKIVYEDNTIDVNDLDLL